MRDRRCLSSSSSSDKWMSPSGFGTALTIERKTSPRRRGGAEKKNICRMCMIRFHPHCRPSVSFSPAAQFITLLAILLFSASPRLCGEFFAFQTSYYKSSLAKIHFHYHSCVQRRERSEERRVGKESRSKRS